MERNLYAPPGATVADPVEPREERPIEVTWAVRLMWTSLAVGVITVLGPYLLQISVGLLLYLLIAGGIRYVISAWIILKIARGRNWARFLFLTVFIFGLGSMAVKWQVYSQVITGKNTLTAVTFVAKTLLDIGAACLLFMPRANRWFRPPRAAITSSESLTSTPLPKADR
jgi:hypothetical protein